MNLRKASVRPGGCGDVCGVIALLRRLERDITNGSVAPQFEPRNTLFVAGGWPTGSDPDVFFTSIGSALTRASALSPTAALPVDVLVAPGTYTENVTIPTNGDIFIKSLGAAATGGSNTINNPDVIISGTVTWAAATGTRKVGMSGLCITGNLTLSGTGSAQTFSGNNLLISGTAVAISGGLYATIDNSVVPNGALAISAGSNLYSSGSNYTSGGTVAGAGSRLAVHGCAFGDTITLTTAAKLVGLNVTDPASGCSFTSISVDNTAGTTADIRGSEYTGTLTSAGANGKINRSYDSQALSTTNATGVSVTFTVPYIAAPDNVIFSQISGTPAAILIPTISATGYTYTDTAIRVGKVSIFQK